MFALIVSNGQYYPGLMFALDSNEQPKGVYKGGEADPSGGGCGDAVPYLQTVAFYTPMMANRRHVYTWGNALPYLVHTTNNRQSW